LVDLYRQTKQQARLTETMTQLAANKAIPQANRAGLLAQLHAALGDREQAESAYLEGLRLAPDSAAMHLLAGRFFAEREPARAEALFRKALELAPSSESARGELGGLLVRRGDPGKRDDARQLLGGLDNPSAAERRLLAHVNEVSTQIAKANELLRPLALDPQATSRDIAMYVQFCIRNALLPDAEAALRQLEGKAPDDWGTVSLRVQWLAAMNRLTEADSRLTAFADKRLKQVDPKPEDLAALLALAGLYDELALSEKAEQRLRQAANLDPLGYRFLANWLATNSRVPEAVQLCVTRARSAGSSQSVRCIEILCEILATGNVPQGANGEAETLIAQALESHSSDVGLVTTVANLRFRQGLAVAAEPLFRQVLRLDANNVVALNNLAMLIADHAQDKSEALALIDLALDKWGRDPALLSTKGYVLLYLNNPSSAREHLWEALADTTQDPRILLYLAKAHLMLGDADAAQSTLERALRGDLHEESLTRGELAWLEELRSAFKVARQVAGNASQS
jgi:Tfp pilus assembly protein PilF